ETQLLITYRGSPIIADNWPDADAESPAPGDRLPDAGGLSQRCVGHPRRLHEYIGRGRHVLLGYIDALDGQYEAFTAACRAFCALLPGAASGVLVVSPGCNAPDDELMTVVTDARGEFAAAFRAPGGALWIVRPDGHIGWRSRDGSGEIFSDWG